MNVTTTEPLRIPAESELAVRLRDAAATGARLRVVTDGATYSLDVNADQDEPPRAAARPRPTPEEVARSREGTRRAVGGWVGLVDAEAFKSYLRERRRTPSREHRWPNE